MKTARKPYGDVIIFYLSGEMTGSPSEQQLINDVRQDIQRLQCRKFIFDTKSVTSINVEGIRTLTNCSVIIKKTGEDPRLSNPTYAIRNAILMNGLTQGFQMANSIEDAVASF